MEEGEEPQKPCQLCDCIPENIICLSCNHTVCLQCAAYAILQKRQPLGSDWLEEDIEDIECPICTENTKVSEEVRAALIDLIQEHLNGDTGEEETDQEGEEELNQSANQGLTQSQTQGFQHKDTSHGEEEYGQEEQSDNRSRTQLSNTRNDQQSDARRPQAARSRVSNTRSKQTSQPASQDLDYLLTFPCKDHPDEYCTHFSPILKNLLCPQCLLGLEEKRTEHNSKPIRKCTA